MKKRDKCTVCGNKSGLLISYVNAETGRKDRLCTDCQANEMVESAGSLEEVDRLITENEEIVGQLEKLIKMVGAKMPSGGGQFAFTPLSAFKAAQRSLADLKSKRLELLIQGETVEQLRYKHNKFVQAEKYEEAAVVLRRLKKMEGK